MHLQLRAVPSASPIDLSAFLRVLADANVNIIAVGGSHIESGGELAIAVDDTDESEMKRAEDVLRKAGYSPRVVEVEYAYLPNKAGQLLAFVDKVRANNAGTGLVIRDIAIGRPDGNDQTLVQIYSDVPWR